MNNKWDMRFLNLARHVAEWSKDPKCKVGAVLVSHDRREITPGYNGFPVNYADSPGRLVSKDKNAFMVHAELNAILNARTRSLSGYRLYCTKPPCLDCAKVMVQVGIHYVNWISQLEPSVTWQLSQERAEKFLYDCGVNIQRFAPDKEDLRDLTQNDNA